MSPLRRHSLPLAVALLLGCARVGQGSILDQVVAEVVRDQEPDQPESKRPPRPMPPPRLPPPEPPAPERPKPPQPQGPFRTFLTVMGRTVRLRAMDRLEDARRTADRYRNRTSGPLGVEDANGRVVYRVR